VRGVDSHYCDTGSRTSSTFRDNPRLEQPQDLSPQQACNPITIPYDPMDNIRLSDRKVRHVSGGGNRRGVVSLRDFPIQAKDMQRASLTRKYLFTLTMLGSRSYSSHGAEFRMVNDNSTPGASSADPCSSSLRIIPSTFAFADD
jgi:hypothetical protein